MKTHLNLMPPADRRRLILARRMRVWLPVWAVALLGSLSVSHFLHRSRMTLEPHVASLERQAAPLRHMRAAADRMATEREHLFRDSVLPPELQNGPSAFEVLAAVAVAAQPTGTDLFVRELTASSESLARTSAPPISSARSDSTGTSDTERSEARRVRMSLEGRATGDISIARFVQSLQELWDEVELTSTAQSERNARAARSFTLTGTMSPGGGP